MNLQLTRPIAFLDLETTGIHVSNDRIVEIAIIKIKPDATQKKWRRLINPEMPIPPEATAIHGISNAMVKDAPTFKEAAGEIKQLLDNTDLGGYNSNKFDIPLLIEEFFRVGIDFETDSRKLIDVQKIFFKMEPRTLAGAYKFYCDKDLNNAHSAEADVEATWQVLEAQICKYPQLGNTIDSIAAQCGDDDTVDYARRFIYKNGVIVFNFGKHKDKPVADVLKKERSYYDWMMQGDFAQNTKQKLTEILTKMMLSK